MECSRESWDGCEYQVILWEELFEQSSSVEAWLNDHFLQNGSMWQDPDLLQLHHFRTEGWLCDNPRPSSHNMCGEPQSLHEIGANHLTMFSTEICPETFSPSLRISTRQTKYSWGTLMPDTQSDNQPRVCVVCLLQWTTMVFPLHFASSSRPSAESQSEFKSLSEWNNLRLDNPSPIFGKLLERISEMAERKLQSTCFILPRKTATKRHSLTFLVTALDRIYSSTFSDGQLRLPPHRANDNDQDIFILNTFRGVSVLQRTHLSFNTLIS